MNMIGLLSGLDSVVTNAAGHCGSAWGSELVAAGTKAGINCSHTAKGLQTAGIYMQMSHYMQVS